MSFTLNPAQREAVRYLDGPLLVLAGAGSGKTRVIAAKIGHLIERGHDPKRIAAITFTNRAAREMRERAAQLLATQGRGALGGRPRDIDVPFVGGEDSPPRRKAIGLKPGFSILAPTISSRSSPS
jgi:ATP-dependent DNA helicase Rep